MYGSQETLHRRCFDETVDGNKARTFGLGVVLVGLLFGVANFALWLIPEAPVSGSDTPPPSFWEFATDNPSGLTLAALVALPYSYYFGTRLWTIRGKTLSDAKTYKLVLNLEDRG